MSDLPTTAMAAAFAIFMIVGLMEDIRRAHRRILRSVRGRRQRRA